jgi:lauroyl/myristoyl acyltransferase
VYTIIEKLTRHSFNRKAILLLSRILPERFFIVGLHIISKLLFYFYPNLRKTIMQNMESTLGNIDKRTLNQNCKNYFTHFMFTLFEILTAKNILSQSLTNRFVTQDEHYLEQVLKEGKGAILFVPHIGNFFYYYLYLSKKYNCLTVATASHAELSPLYLLFKELGCKGLDYDQTPPLTLFRTLQNHLDENGVIFLFGDFCRPQFPLSKMFDRLIRCPNGSAMLALNKRIPIIPFYGFRVDQFTHQLVFDKPQYLHEFFHPSERQAATNYLNLFLEKYITAVPEQWLYWFDIHQKWQELEPPIKKTS